MEYIVITFYGIYNYDMEINMAGVGALVEGPIFNGKGSFMSSFRQAFLKYVITKFIFSADDKIDPVLTNPPSLIFLSLNSLIFFISVGDLKYTTFSSSDFSIKKIVKTAASKARDKKSILNLTFLPYIKIQVKFLKQLYLIKLLCMSVDFLLIAFDCKTTFEI